MTLNLRIPLAALLLVGASLAIVPAADAHNCIQRAAGSSDPSGCNGHNCQDGAGIHLYHVVIHGGDNAAIHGCGVLLHVGVDGQGGYVCIEAGRCFQIGVADLDLLA